MQFSVEVGWKVWKQPEAGRSPGIAGFCFSMTLFSKMGKHCAWHSATCAA